MGRQGEYTEEVGLKICEKIATSNMGLHRLHKAFPNDFPAPSMIMRWLNNPDEKYNLFREQYARAREEQAEFLAEEMIEIADDSSQDDLEIDTPKGKQTIENKEWTNRSRLRVDTRKWIASKLKPKKFGDKIDVTSKGESITSVTPTVISTGASIASKESDVEQG